MILSIVAATVLFRCGCVILVSEANSVSSPQKSECQAGCSHCSATSPEPAVVGEEIFTGWRLGAAALWVFLLPLALAVVGAIVARSYWSGPTRMLIAALTGLAVGGAISSAASRRIRTTHTDNPVEQAYVEPHNEI
jgi:hypothetical protein